MATPLTGLNLAISDHFAAQCAPVIDTNYDTCGTITRASITYLTKAQIDSVFSPGGLFGDLDSWFKHTIEMKSCGVKRFALYDWIMANADRETYRRALFPGEKTRGGPELVRPWILAKQSTVINRDHWKITAGGTGIYASVAAFNASPPATLQTSVLGTSGGLATSYNQGGNTYPLNVGGQLVANARVIRVESRYGVPLDAKHFSPGDTLHIFNTANGVNQHGQWKVIDSVNDAAMTYCYIYISSHNSGSLESFDANPGSTNPCYMIPGVNNVNDYEKWCYNRPTLDPRKLVPFWKQTFRRSRCVDSEYKLVYAKLMEGNAAFRAFGDLDLAERNRQDELEENKRFVNDFFYNKPISYNQDLNRWDQLEKINTVDGASITTGLNNKLIAYRANFIGVREQLRVCGQVFDELGNALNWYEWLDLNYAIKRARETRTGGEVKDIDWVTSSNMRALMQSGYVNYIAKEYAGTPPRMIFEQDKLNTLGQVYDTYRVKRPGGVNINILEDTYFDDRLDQMQDLGQEAAGNLLWCVNLGKEPAGSIYWAQMAANRRSTTSAKIEELARIDTTFRCTLEYLSIDQMLMSQEGSAIVTCPLENAMVENLALTVPNTGGQSKAGGSNTYYDLV